MSWYAIKQRNHQNTLSHPFSYSLQYLTLLHSIEWSKSKLGIYWIILRAQLDITRQCSPFWSQAAMNSVYQFRRYCWAPNLSLISALRNNSTFWVSSITFLSQKEFFYPYQAYWRTVNFLYGKNSLMRRQRNKGSLFQKCLFVF